MEDPADDVLAELAKLEPRATDRWIGELLGFAPVPAIFIAEWMAPAYLVRGIDNPLLSENARARIWTLLAESGDRTIERRLAAHPATPAWILDRLAGDIDDELRRELAKFGRVAIDRIEIEIAMAAASSDPDELVRFAASPHAAVRFALARNEAIPADAAIALANDRRPEVRATIAKNVSTPPEALALLAAEHPEIASQPQCPSSTLAQLAAHPDAGIRMRVARHASAPLGAIERLVKDPDPKVAASAAQHPLAGAAERARAFAADAIKGSRIALDALAAMEDVPLDVLQQLAEAKEPRVHSLVLMHRSTPPELLASIAMKTHSRELMQAAASNPALPVAVIDGIGEGCRRMHQEAIRAAFAASKEDGPDAERMIAEHARLSSLDVRLMAAFNPSAPKHLRAELLTEVGSYEQCVARVRAWKEPLRAAALRNLRAWASAAELELLAKTEPQPPTPPTPRPTPDPIAVLADPNAPPDAKQRAIDSAPLHAVLERIGDPHLQPLAARARSTAIKLAIAASADLTDEAAASLLREPPAFDVVLANPVMTTGRLEAIVERYQITRREVIERLVNRSDLSADMALKLAERRTLNYFVARRKGLPIAVYEKLIGDPSLRSTLVSNESLPARLLEIILREGGADLRAIVAANPSAGSLVGALADEADVRIVAAIARNPSAPAEARARAAERLATESEDWARAAAAGCSDASDAVLERLARDPRESVRLAMQQHPRGRRWLLAEYARSPLPFVRFVARLHPEVPEDLLADHNRDG